MNKPEEENIKFFHQLNTIFLIILSISHLSYKAQNDLDIQNQRFRAAQHSIL